MSSSHGVTLLGDGQAVFRLWAPTAHTVEVEFVNEARTPLQKAGNGWFATTISCGAGTLYRFVINGNQRVPDPASRSQPDGIHGFSRVVDHGRYSWQHPHWRGRPWHEAIIYELHVGLLNGFAGAASYLPYLAELGITAIELMPIGEFPGTRNWGYDGVLPFAPHSSYGDPDDLKNLVDTAHGLGLMVYVDVVYNHFGPEGNYLSLYARDFFRDDVSTPWGSAIDFRRREVRDYFSENAVMWLGDYRVDGLRLDAVHAIPDHDFLTELARRARQAAPDRHIHLILENEGNCAELLENGFDAQWNDDGHNVLHTILTGEQEGYYQDFATAATRRLARCLQEGFIYQGECTQAGHARGQPSGHLPPTAFVLFLQNHDQVGNRAHGERLVTLADEDTLKAATALLLLCPMVPLLFMGEEWGTSQPFLYFTDHPEPLARAVREGRQREFRHFSAFSQEAGIPLPDPNHPATFQMSRPYYVSEGESRNGEWHNYYSQLLRLRHQYILPRLKDARAHRVEIIGDTALAAQWIMGDGSLLSLVFNLTDKGHPADSHADEGEIIFSQGALPQRGRLPPGSLIARWRKTA